MENVRFACAYILVYMFHGITSYSVTSLLLLVFLIINVINSWPRSEWDSKPQLPATHARDTSLRLLQLA